MKKWIIGFFILVVACTAATLVERGSTVQAEKAPTPYIKFDGKNVSYVPGMPDCH
jgi:hypothetical protein